MMHDPTLRRLHRLLCDFGVTMSGAQWLDLESRKNDQPLETALASVMGLNRGRFAFSFTMMWVDQEFTSLIRLEDVLQSRDWCSKFVTLSRTVCRPWKLQKKKVHTLAAELDQLRTMFGVPLVNKCRKKDDDVLPPPFPLTFGSSINDTRESIPNDQHILLHLVRDIVGDEQIHMRAIQQRVAQFGQTTLPFFKNQLALITFARWVACSWLQADTRDQFVYLHRSERAMHNWLSNFLHLGF